MKTKRRRIILKSCIQEREQYYNYMGRKGYTLTGIDGAFEIYEHRVSNCDYKIFKSNEETHLDDDNYTLLCIDRNHNIYVRNDEESDIDLYVDELKNQASSQAIRQAGRAILLTLFVCFIALCFFAVTVPSILSDTLNFGFLYAFYFFLVIAGVVLIVDLLYLYRISLFYLICKKIYCAKKIIKTMAIILILFNPFVFYQGTNYQTYTFEDAPTFILQLSDIEDSNLNYNVENRIVSQKYYDSTLYYISQKADSSNNIVYYSMTIHYYVFDTSNKAKKKYNLVRGDNNNLYYSEYNYDFDYISFEAGRYYILKDKTIIVFNFSTNYNKEQYTLSALDNISNKITNSI